LLALGIRRRHLVVTWANWVVAGCSPVHRGLIRPTQVNSLCSDMPIVDRAKRLRIRNHPDLSSSMLRQYRRSTTTRSEHVIYSGSTQPKLERLSFLNTRYRQGIRDYAMRILYQVPDGLSGERQEYSSSAIMILSPGRPTVLHRAGGSIMLRLFPQLRAVSKARRIWPPSPQRGKEPKL